METIHAIDYSRRLELFLECLQRIRCTHGRETCVGSHKVSLMVSGDVDLLAV